MKRTLHIVLSVIFLWIGLAGVAQEVVSPFKWTIRSSRVSANQYELVFSTTGSRPWQLYAPNQTVSDIPVVELRLGDSSFVVEPGFKDSGAAITVQSAVFETQVRLYEGPSTWRASVTINGPVPAELKGTLLYSYGKGDEFYPSTSLAFTVPLEGGVSATSRILIPNLHLKDPVNPCGDDDTGDKSMWTLFFIGLGAGLLALLFPCVFPLIPLTVSFFTKRAQSRRKGILNAVWYGMSIFLIYTLLSLPFHLFNVQPEVLNNISTNVPLNLAFFIVFVMFAISFFGYFEITLPSGIANKADAKSGLGDILGIFFMALTLAIVSFSCTSGILGALLVGALNGPNGAWQLTAGMAGFGLGLGLPFILFALFPNWLQSLPKSGGWMNELKAVFGFIELAMAVKFLSNADLVMQWHLLQREVFIGIWILIGLAIVLYLTGIFRFANDSKVKFTPIRVIFILLFAGLTIALLPGVTNTKSARLGFISGFPPPFSYTVYQHSVNYETGVEPLHNDYEKALQLAREQNKPVLIDFTGWACVNCRRMEENVWVDEEVKDLMKNKFIVVSLYVDERKKLPVTQQFDYKGKNGSEKSIVTVGDKWATFQSENFNAVAQPQYAIISPDERALTKTKAYTPTATQFSDWLKCGLEAYEKDKRK